MQQALIKANEAWVAWPEGIKPQVMQKGWTCDTKYVAVMNQAVANIEARTLRTENVALQGLHRNGVLIFDMVSNRGIFVENANDGIFWKSEGLQILKVSDWAQIRRAEIKALIAAGDQTDMAFIDLPPLSLGE